MSTNRHSPYRNELFTKPVFLLGLHEKFTISNTPQRRLYKVILHNMFKTKRNEQKSIMHLFTGKRAQRLALTYKVGEEYGQEHRDPYGTQRRAPPAAVL